MSVTVTHDGEPASDSLSVAAGSEEGSVVLTQGDLASVSLTCIAGCTVLINP
jgi:hypothetical protein